ncbi:MAG TPA: hypothetical protein VK204_18225 [Nocardioidaceae bacterium]|nr:hypothetical protein [Nocardioidaceae bacterium]
MGRHLLAVWLPMLGPPSGRERHFDTGGIDTPEGREEGTKGLLDQLGAHLGG